jgi:hypothetical protein
MHSVGLGKAQVPGELEMFRVWNGAMNSIVVFHSFMNRILKRGNTTKSARIGPRLVKLKRDSSNKAAQMTYLG